jgi:small-conductance mechanosensitive channel
MTRDILFNIKKEFDAHGIKIPSPRRQLIIGEDLLKNFRK